MKLLLIVPHPDDEVYGAGGTIMEFVGSGQTVGLVTLTRGEKGRTLGLADSPQELGRLRTEELRACLEELGVSEHRHLDYPDGFLRDVPLETLVAEARSALDAYRPEIVLTFAPNGSNGHPDHVTTSLAVRRALVSLGDARPEVWYYAGPSPAEERLIDGYFPPNLSRDVTPFLARKLRAIACHRTQALSTVDFFRRFAERIVTESFHRIPKGTAHPSLDSAIMNDPLVP